MTAEIKDTYEAFYETQTDATTKQKLSKLETDIQAHISTSVRDKLENAITGSEKDVKINPSELIRSIYSQRMTRDIMMKHLGAGKTQKLSLGDKIRQKIKDRGADILLKQKNSYDAVLTQMEAPVIEQFKAELDDLKKSIVAAPAVTDVDTPATNKSSAETHENE